MHWRRIGRCALEKESDQVRALVDDGDVEDVLAGVDPCETSKAKQQAIHPNRLQCLSIPIVIPFKSWVSLESLLCGVLLLQRLR